MINIQITVSGSTEVIKKLQAFEVELNDWHDVFNNVGDYLMDVYSRQVFSTEGGILGDRWADLSPAYELWKAKRYAGRGILEASGRLKGGFQKRIGSQDMEIKNTTPYAVYHQSTEPRSKIPRRPIIGMSGDIESKVIRYFVDGISGKIKKVFA